MAVTVAMFDESCLSFGSDGMRFVRLILHSCVVAALGICLARLLYNWMFDGRPKVVPLVWAMGFVGIFTTSVIGRLFTSGKDNSKESSTGTQGTGKHRDSEDSKRSLDQASRRRDDSNPYSPLHVEE